MNVHFQDLERDDNSRNGDGFTSSDELLRLLDELRRSRPPFMCELVGDNGFTLTVGIGSDIGCVQYGCSDGTPPYLMAVEKNTQKSSVEEVEFVVGGTPTPIDGRYCLPFTNVKKIVDEFVTSGNKSDAVTWEEF